MADPSPTPDSNSDTGDDTGTPRWVKVSVIIAAVLVLLVVIVMLTGVGGSHGPGRHAPSGDAGGQVAPSSVVEDHAPPEGSRG